jgi:hypothetical protein
VLTETDARVDSCAPRVCDGRAVVRQAGIVDGALVCWEADLAPEVSVSTDPGAAEPASSWRSQLLLAPLPQPVQPGETLAVSITFDRPPRIELAVVADANRVTA